MKRFTLLKISCMAVGGLMVGLLGIHSPDIPTKWIQTLLLGPLGASPAKVQAGLLENKKDRMPSFQIAKGARPAAKGESPEEAQLKKLPPAIPPGQVGRPSKAELVDKCLKNPRCQAKVKEANQKGPQKPRPATREESPEEKAMKQLPQPIPPKAPRQQPRSKLVMPNEEPKLLSWLNPFQVAPVYAQSPISIHLTPGGSVTSSSYLTLYGAIVYINNGYFLSSGYTLPSAHTENKPFAYLRFTVPATGTYLINVQAGRGKAKLRHLSNGPIIDTWDFSAQPYGTYNYLTAEYLEQGYHYFYFWPDGGAFYIYSASLESY